MTDQGSKSCTPVKEMEALKIIPSQNKDTDDEMEDHFEGVKTDEVCRSVCERIPTEKMLAYPREESQKAEKKTYACMRKMESCEARKARGQLKTDIPSSTYRHTGK